MKPFNDTSVFIAALLLSFSCTPPQSEVEAKLCTITCDGKEVSQLQFNDAASEKTAYVFADVSWTIEESSDWLQVSPSSGSAALKGAAVKISVSENPSEASRETILHLKVGELSKTLTIMQKGHVVIHEGWEDAFSAVRNMGVGWNLGNTLDTWLKNGPDGKDWRAWETGWGQSVTKPELMQMMKNAGFGAIRVPVTWGPHMDASGKVHAEWMNRVHEIVDYVIGTGMYCIVNLHHDTGAGKDAWVVADKDMHAANRDRYISLWKQVAEEFASYDHKLIFEAYNEMLDSRSSWCFPTHGYAYDASYASGAYEAVNGFAQDFVDAVRSTGGNNLYRNLVVNTYAASNGNGSWSNYLKDPLKYLDMPEDVSAGHIIFQVHAYPDIANMNAVKAEMDQMYANLHEHLVSKGGPVIIGEWGTSNVDTAPDYIHRHDDMLEFADYFIRKAKEYDMATFYWMGLSNAGFRSIPAFNEPDLAETIAKAYHGAGYQGEYPVMDDYDISYKVTYNQQWGELNLSTTSLSLDVYSGVKVVLGSVPDAGVLSVKMYGKDSREQYYSVSSAEDEYLFNKSILGSNCDRVTLQYCKTGTYSAIVKSVYLIRRDGELEKVTVEPFWGCSLDMIAE